MYYTVLGEATEAMMKDEQGTESGERDLLETKSSSPEE